MAATVFGTWAVGKPVGTGTYGKVYQIEGLDGTRCAYKVMKIPVELDDTPGQFPKKTQEMCLKEVRKEISSSIKFLQQNDRGRFFAKDEDFTLVPSDDFKSLTLKIRMEWLLSLKAVMEQTYLTEDEILRMAINICTSLEKCRGLGYVYSNLKPDNIFITEKRCKLGDFGNFGYYEPVNMNVSMRRTQEFSAPELIKSGEINQTSDTYSLGLIIYTLLNSNRLPFIPRYEKSVGINDINLAIEKRCANYIFPDPDNGSQAVRKIIAKACSASVEARYQSPSDMKQDLLYLLHKQEELIGTYTKKEENAPAEVPVKEEKPAISVEKIKTYEYEDTKKKTISLDKKRKILLIAIAVMFLVLVGLIVATLLRDTNTANIITTPLEAALNDYGWGQAFSQHFI